MTLETVSHFCANAGADWVVWLLGALVLVVFGTTLQRIWALRTLGGDPSDLIMLLKPILSGEYFSRETQSKILGGLRRRPSSAAALSEVAVSHADRGSRAVEKAVEAHVLIERLRLERGLTVLSTIATNAPFVGLLGTVVGVMHAFSALGASQAQADVTGALMQGVAEALVTTGIGLAVALPAVIAHNFLRQRAEAILSGAQALAGQIVAAVPETPMQARRSAA